jgi:hypothetical protein
MDQLKTPVKKNMWDFESSNQKASVVLNPQFFINNMGAAKNKCQGKKRIPQRLILSYTLDRGACRSGRSCSWSFLLVIHHNHFTSRQLLGCTFLLLLSWFFSAFSTLLPQPLFPSSSGPASGPAAAAAAAAKIITTTTTTTTTTSPKLDHELYGFLWELVKQTHCSKFCNTSLVHVLHFFHL